MSTPVSINRADIQRTLDCAATAPMMGDKKGMMIEKYVPVEIVQNKKTGEIITRGPERIGNP